MVYSSTLYVRTITNLRTSTSICRPNFGKVSQSTAEVPRLVTFHSLCKIFLAAPWPDPEFLVSDTGQVLFIFWLRILHFALV